MSDSLADMEARRASVQSQISPTWSTCALAPLPEPVAVVAIRIVTAIGLDDSGHGPYYRLTRKVKGKTVTQSFSILAA